MLFSLVELLMDYFIWFYTSVRIIPVHCSLCPSWPMEYSSYFVYSPLIATKNFLPGKCVAKKIDTYYRYYNKNNNKDSKKLRTTIKKSVQKPHHK